MEIELKGIDFDADICEIYEAVARVLHGPELYDPNDQRNKGRKPYFEIVPGESPAGRIHNGTALLHVSSGVGGRLFQWIFESPKNTIVVGNSSRALRLFKTHRELPPDVEYKLEKALYVDPNQEKERQKIEDKARQARLRIAKVQFGVWYTQPKSNSRPNHGRIFSIEHEREFVSQSAAYINIVYERRLICIDIGQRETEEINYRVLVKFSSIRKLGIGSDAEHGPCIIFDLRVPPSFELESYNNRVPEGIQCRGRRKTRDPISSLDESHALVAPYAFQLRVVLTEGNDLRKFEEICKEVQCQPVPRRVYRVDSSSKQFFRQDVMDNVSDWIKKMEWKCAFQIEAYLRGGLLNTDDLLVSLRNHIGDVIRHYKSEAGEFFRLFSSVLGSRDASETPGACLARFRAENPIIDPVKLGPFETQSNRVIRRYKDHDPTLVARFVRVEFRDEDHLAYRWDGDVDGTWFLQRRVGKILREGFEVAGRKFEFLAYSTSSLREHAVWFVSPFRDPVEGYVNARTIRASLGDFSDLLRTPSKWAARIAQAFTATDPSVKIRRGQWEEQDDLGPHTDGDESSAYQFEDKRVRPSAYQFRFLGYKGVVVVDSRLKGIKMRLRKSQRKFPVPNVSEAEFEIARSFDYPNSVHLNRFVVFVSYAHTLSLGVVRFFRPAVMALEDLGVKKKAFVDLQEDAKARIYLAKDSLKIFAGLLRSQTLGLKFHLPFILEQLMNLGLDFRDHLDKEAIRSAFLGRLSAFADEGRAYIKEGARPDKVFTLREKQIYVCVQESTDKEPEYLKGACLISRSPVIHPGDIQRVYAVGKPPDDKICFFSGLKNVVVLPAIGDRSSASCLAGGDLDGDTFDIYYDNPDLLTSFIVPPAEYPPGEVWTLNERRGDATVEDICDFIVEFISSDVMGLLADRHIIIADQSKDGVFDDKCMKLAELCSKAVDYAKNGKRVDLRGNLPKTLIRFKPDWHKAEVTGARDLDYYVSDRALGELFRKIDLYDPTEPLQGFPTTPPGDIAPLDDAISRALKPLVRYALVGFTFDFNRATGSGSPSRKPPPPPPPPAPGPKNAHAERLHARYTREMRCICATHTLVEAPDVRLTEEEVVLGTILANCTQPRWRSDRAQRMRLQSETLVRDIRAHIVLGDGGRSPAAAATGIEESEERLKERLRSAWATWVWAQHHRDREYIESFALIALGVVLDCLKRLGELPDA
ncbi:RdRP-domain-containing protein [Lactarius akahatsu]|uniref:RNA-dependent RNA polymerase n=1 Tax=Lactarius akahatsu TaxID=416441 RepID=A0AAD4QA08_9AGAM|nr:RdRP-domain-containing protein [Lactarius akahatsu]